MVDLSKEEYMVFSWFKGELGQKLIERKYFSNLPEGVIVIDGHDPREYSNLSIGGIPPVHLDIVGLERENNKVKFICEVKTTVTDKIEFKANGFCMVFMKKAKESGIPVYFAVVRLNREVDKKILISYDKSTKEAEIDKELFDSELEYFLEHAKTEFYDQNRFEMRKGKFLIKQ